jgi:hypothetical protein
MVLPRCHIAPVAACSCVGLESRDKRPTQRRSRSCPWTNRELVQQRACGPGPIGRIENDVAIQPCNLTADSRQCLQRESQKPFLLPQKPSVRGDPRPGRPAQSSPSMSVTKQVCRLTTSRSRSKSNEKLSLEGAPALGSCGSEFRWSCTFTEPSHDA